MFEFRTHGRTIAGPGTSARLGDVLATGGRKRAVCVVTDGDLVRLGLVQTFCDGLRASGHTVHLFDEVVADPPDHVVARAITVARESAADTVIGFGGGSSLDVAKLTAAFTSGQQDFRDCYGIDKITASRLSLVQVPTTAGTGSEATSVAIVTAQGGSKAGVVSPVLYADIAVLDAELTRGLPPAVTAATGIDAMVHATEAYTSRIHKNPMSDLLAREALRLMYRALPSACADGSNLTARQDMLLGAMLAGQAFANAPVGAVHALAYPLGSGFHVAHGLSNALVLGPVLNFNLPVSEPLYAELADVIFPGGGGDTREKAAKFVEKLSALSHSLGLPTRLTQVGVQASDVPALAHQALQQQRLLVNNPRAVSLADAERLYREAL